MEKQPAVMVRSKHGRERERERDVAKSIIELLQSGLS